MVLPMDKVGCRRVCPLVAAQAAQPLVMPLVEQVDQMEDTIVRERHRVAGEGGGPSWFEVLHKYAPFWVCGEC